MNADRPVDGGRGVDPALLDALDGLNQAAVVFGPDGRLSECNRSYVETWPQLHDMIRTGVTAQELFEAAWERNVFARAGNRRDVWIEASMKRYAALDGSEEIELSDGRWLNFVNRALSDGSTLTVVRDVTAEKQRQLDAAREADAFRDLALSFADWFWQTDSEHRFVTPTSASLPYANQLPYFFGKTRWEAVGADIEADPDWRAHVRSMEAHRPFRDFRYSYVGSDGKWRSSRISGVPIFDDKGRFTGYRGTGIDETALSEADRRAGRAETVLRDAIDSLGDGVLLFDSDDRLVLWNKAQQAVYEPVGIIFEAGMTFESFVVAVAHSGLVEEATDDPDQWIARRLNLPRPSPAPIERRIGGEWYEIREAPTSDGGYIQLLSNVSRLKDQHAELMAIKASLEMRVEERTRSLAEAVVRAKAEAGQRATAERQLRASEEKFRAIAEGISSGLYVHDGQDALFVNRALIEMLGFDDEADLKAAGSIETHYHPDELPRLRQLAKDRREGLDVPDRYEVRMRRKDGSIFWSEQFVALIAWEDRQAFLCAAVDVDSRRRMTEELRHATEAAERANDAKSQFLAKMSHELRTPLNAIIGFSEMISNEVLGPVGSPKYASYSQDIVHSGRHLLELINDLLDLSKIEAGAVKLDRSDIHLQRMIEECFDLMSPLAEGRQVRLAAVMPEDRLVMRADRRSMKQVLINLMSNAIKFNRRGGTVEVAAERISGGCRITVRDDGIGIADADLDVLFRPFGQIDNQMVAEQKGTGLGLSIVRGLVELHDGEVSVHSRPGEGTAVSLTLPDA
ncbi:MAG: ATP-binding protein [Minwuia sp.]|uniref:ATP-binding protein n=1 Tax=Minwuia sp. TaxID=2493630 RepID=UPI003A87F00A